LGKEFVDLQKQADQLNADIRDGKTGDCDFFANFDKQQFYEVIKNETY